MVLTVGNEMTCECHMQPDVGYSIVSRNVICKMMWGITLWIAVTSACGRGSTVGRYNGHGSVLPIHAPASPGAALGCESVMSMCTRATQ